MAPCGAWNRGPHLQDRECGPGGLHAQERPLRISAFSTDFLAAASA